MLTFFLKQNTTIDSSDIPDVSFPPLTDISHPFCLLTGHLELHAYLVEPPLFN